MKKPKSIQTELPKVHKPKANHGRKVRKEAGIPKGMKTKTIFDDHNRGNKGERKHDTPASTLAGILKKRGY